MDILSGALQLAFFAVFGVALWRYLQRPGKLELAVVAVFAPTAAIFSLALLNALSPGISDTFRPLAVSLLMAQPVLVLRLVGLLRRLPRWVLPLTFAGFVIAVLGVLLPAQTPPPVLVFVAAYFIVVEGAAAVLLLGEAVRRHGLPRFRLALAGLATALFGLAIFTAAAGNAAAAGQGTPQELLVVSRTFALLAGLGYLGAFLPPRWLRDMGQRAVAFDLGIRLVAPPQGTQPVVLWRALALAARDILGARRAELRSDQAVLATTDDEGLEARSVQSPDEDRARPRQVLEVPIDPGGRLPLVLRAEVEGTPIFLDDDLAALTLLGTMTQRAVEREEAVIRLAEASRELDRTAEVRASEARFRALLEAHPNAVLATDSTGKVTWATGMTGELFGRSAQGLMGKSLADLISYENDVLQAVAGPGILRTEGEARRADGSTFPADVAISDFEHDGAGFQLVVVSDASWRQEANTLRDRFLGVLSHELRTPITAIYGGTQLLIKRGERLDEATRDELLVGVTAEAERLQRIIENLLVLARVERGADFFDPRPVLLKPVFTDLVEHERRMLPGLTIELSLERVLPLVAADEEYLALVVRNLLSNAAKYAGPQAKVEISVTHEGSEVVTRVLDDGPGIESNESDQIFGLYYRSNTTAAAAGAGIGLFVCKGLVNAMNGRIWARPRQGGGAEFGFALPVYEEEELQGAVAEERPVQPAIRPRLATESAEAI